MWRRILSVIKKIARGESITAIVLPAADWDRQYEKGNWDFLLDSQQNVVLIGHLLREMAAAGVVYGCLMLAAAMGRSHGSLLVLL
jgi:hypothetical protein